MKHVTLNHDLAKTTIHSGNRARYVQMLRGGPWCWPRENAEDPYEQKAWQKAIRLVTEGPPSMEPGMVPLVGLEPSSRQAFLYVCLGKPSCQGQFGFRSLPLIHEAQDAWKRALMATPRSLRFLWAPLRDLSRMDPAHVYELNGIQILQTLPSDTSSYITHARPHQVDGQSFGLSFALSIASSIFELPLESNIFASAAIASDGRLRTVDGLEEKIACLYHCSPLLRRIFVAADDRQKAEECIERLGWEEWRVEAVKSVSEAIELIWGQKVEEKLTQLAENPNHRKEVVEAIFSLALDLRGVVFDWIPVKRAAHLMLDTMQERFSLSEKNKLIFSRDVALRHVANYSMVRFSSAVDFAPHHTNPSETLHDTRSDNSSHQLTVNTFPALDASSALLSEDFLEDLCLPTRLKYLANLIQNSLDTGFPSPADVLLSSAADAMSVVDEKGTYKNAFGEHLRLQGALARLYSCTGRIEEALQMQRKLVSAWLERHVYDTSASGDLSYPLSEWFRLTGALKNKESFDDACKLSEKIAMLASSFEEKHSCYVELAKGRAHLLFCEWKESRKILEKLVKDQDIHRDVRWCCIRWLIYSYRADMLLDSVEKEKQVSRCIDQWNQEIEKIADNKLPSEEIQQHEEYGQHGFMSTLMELDRVVLLREIEQIAPILSKLQNHPSGYGIQLLLRHAPVSNDLARAEYVIRFGLY